jgi:hypothetical protein
MIRLTLAAAVAALVIPALASAKEPSQASISGPHFSKTLRPTSGNEWGETPLALVTDLSGFFPSSVGQSPDPMLHGRPQGSLGPRYTIVWTVPGPPGPTTHRVRQDLYPYARGGAVTYTRPGQPIFDMTTRGGWYRSPELKNSLVALGLPQVAPRSSAGTNTALIAGLAAAVAAALAVAGLVWWRQRGQRSPSTSSTELPAGSRT